MASRIYSEIPHGYVNHEPPLFWQGIEEAEENGSRSYRIEGLEEPLHTGIFVVHGKRDATFAKALALGRSVTINGVHLARRQSEPTLTSHDRTDKEAAALFESLAQTWQDETAHLSSLTQSVLHESYQRIIGMGPQALPLLLKALEEQPELWFWALWAISGQDPAAGVDTFSEARDKWLEWGRAQGYLS